MSEVIRWCGSAAAGTETARMNQMREAYGDPDEGTAYVLASDYDALKAENERLIEQVERLATEVETLQNDR